MNAEVAVCRKCRNEIERTPLGGWGTRSHRYPNGLRMIRGCRHIPVPDSVRPATPLSSGQPT